MNTPIDCERESRWVEINFKVLCLPTRTNQMFQVLLNTEALPELYPAIAWQKAEEQLLSQHCSEKGVLEHGLFMGPMHSSKRICDCGGLGPFVMQRHGKEIHFLIFRGDFIFLLLPVLQI